MRWSTSMREAHARASRRSPAPRASCRAATARVPGSRAITSRVAPVSALIGLNERLPQSLTQISSRICGRTGALRPAAIRAWRQALDALGALPRARRGVNRSPSCAGSRPARRPRPPDRRRSRWPAPGRWRPTARRRDRRSRARRSSQRAAEPVEIPPGHAVRRRDHGRLGAEQRPHRRRRRPAAPMRLERDDDVVLRAGSAGSSVARGRTGDALAAERSVSPFARHRREVGAARDQADLGARRAPARPPAARRWRRRRRCRSSCRRGPSFSARPIRCSLPVAPFGISSRNTTLRGTLKSASRVGGEVADLALARPSCPRAARPPPRPPRRAWRAAWRR